MIPPSKIRLMQIVALGSDFAVIVTAFALATLIYHRYQKDHASEAQTAVRLRDAASRPTVPKLEFSHTDYTLVLALATHCPFCEQSVPFYRRLQSSSSASRVQFMALFSEPEQEATLYLNKQGLSYKHIANVDFEGMNIEGTPTLLLIDRKGHVMKTWVGILDEVNQDDVLKSLEQSPKVSDGSGPHGGYHYVFSS